MPGLFVDTAAWIGLEVANDQNHRAAVAFGQMARRRYHWVTTNWVIWETVTWLRYHTGHASAVRFGERVQAAERLELISVTAQHETSAWEVLKRYGDKRFSFIDCGSCSELVTAHDPRDQGWGYALVIDGKLVDGDVARQVILMQTSKGP